LPNLHCKFKNEKGVIHIYDDKFNDPPFNEITYPDLKTFIDDYRLLVTLIGDGPL
jgi:hypothetical protein